MLTKKISFLFFLSVTFTFLQAQISNDSIYKEIIRARNVLAPKEPKEALKILLKTKELSKQNQYGLGIVKSSYTLMLLYYNGGDYKKVIEESKTLEKYAAELNDNEILSDVFRMKAIA